MHFNVNVYAEAYIEYRLPFSLLISAKIKNGILPYVQRLHALSYY